MLDDSTAGFRAKGLHHLLPLRAYTDQPFTIKGGT
jgi:hypothetical protein